MKILVIDFDKLHHKNKRGLIQMFSYIKKFINKNINYLSGNIIDINNDYDIIYSPCRPIDTSGYPNIKFIFGPHFSVFPNSLLDSIQNTNNNSIYIQPSEWAVDVWKNLNAENLLPLKVLSFAVNTSLFKPVTNNRDKVMIYYKRRKPAELKFIIDFLIKKGEKFLIFNYVKRYHEREYQTYLQQCKYGIIIDAHESQGFAIEEALSSDVPLIVWNVTSMNQEYLSNYSSIPATSIPYWDERCGEFFYNTSEFHNIYNKFINNLPNYRPREYIMEYLSAEPCAKRFYNLLTYVLESHSLETK